MTDRMLTLLFWAALSIIIWGITIFAPAEPMAPPLLQLGMERETHLPPIIDQLWPEYARGN